MRGIPSMRLVVAVRVIHIGAKGVPLMVPLSTL
jgi:hypothetical protein